MFLVLLISIIFSACLVVSYRIKIAYVISLYFFGCVMLMFAGFYYFISISNYIYLSNVDYQMLEKLKSFKISLYGASVIQMIGVAFIMIASILCLQLVYPGKGWLKISLLIPVVYVFTVNLPSVDWMLYLKMHSMQSNSQALNIADVFRWSSVAIVIMYLLAPVAMFAAYAAKTKIFVKRRYGISCIVCIILVYVVIWILFVDGVFTPMMFYNTDLLNFPTKELGVYSERGVMLFSVVCIMAINFYIILYFKPFEKYGADSKRRFVKRSRAVNENVFMLIHTYKNRFLGIGKLAQLGMENLHEGECLRYST